jgi:hypothetical protein
MARYVAKILVQYEVSVETNAKDDDEADTNITAAIDEHLGTIAGNYSGTKIDVLRQSKKLLAFHTKSDEAQEEEKRGNIVSYVAQLDSEERALLREFLIGG